MLDLSPVSAQNSFRKKRIQSLARMINDVIRTKGHCRIIDIGGVRGFWLVWRDELDFSNITVDCVNLFPETDPLPEDMENVHMRLGNACDLADVADNAYDIAFSNSVIEHVGSWSNKKAFAREARRVAPSYAIQTPSFAFPVEPHARTPFLHWLPDPLRYRIHLAMTTGFYPKAADLDQAMASLEDARMLDLRQMRYLFPDGEIEKEKFFGLTKSFTAVRHGQPH